VSTLRAWTLQRTSFGLAKRQQHCEDCWCHVKDSKETPRQEYCQSRATEGIHREIVTLCLWVTLISVLPDTIQAFTNNYKDSIFPPWGRKSLQRVVKRSRCKWRKFQAKRKTRVARASVSAWWFTAASKGVGLSGQWSFMHADGTWPHNGVKFCKICHNGDVRGARANVNSRQQTSYYTGEVSGVLPAAQRVYKARLATGDCRGQKNQ
jgi:hypothetical protein